MSSSGAQAYRKRLEQAARLKAAGKLEEAGHKLPQGFGAAETDEAQAKRQKISAARKADYLIRDAMNRGEFDNLRYAGKPIPGLDDPDPDWWIKRLIKRENISGLGPPALLLRVEDEDFEARLNQLPSEPRVQEAVDDFNARIIEARRQLLGGPPVITKLRDAGEEIRGWRQRRGLSASPPKQQRTALAGADSADSAEDTAGTAATTTPESAAAAAAKSAARYPGSAGWMRCRGGQVPGWLPAWLAGRRTPRG